MRTTIMTRMTAAPLSSALRRSAVSLALGYVLSCPKHTSSLFLNFPGVLQQDCMWGETATKCLKWQLKGHDHLISKYYRTTLLAPYSWHGSQIR